jgi:DNA-binding transcriptional ArsR family regulator
MPDDELPGGVPANEAPIPHRKLQDARELRAMAHPLRVRILDLLFVDGPLTATDLSERLGESPANCSWHLRQLAKYGYVEETGGGTGRQRPWRPVLESRSWGGAVDEGELAAAGTALSEMMFRREIDERRAYQARFGSEPAEWQDAAFSSQSLAWLTVEELTALSGEIYRLFVRHIDRITDPAKRPEGARPVRLVGWASPARSWQQDES